MLSVRGVVRRGTVEPGRLGTGAHRHESLAVDQLQVLNGRDFVVAGAGAGPAALGRSEEVADVVRNGRDGSNGRTLVRRRSELIGRLRLQVAAFCGFGVLFTAQALAE